MKRPIKNELGDIRYIEVATINKHDVDHGRKVSLMCMDDGSFVALGSIEHCTSLVFSESELKAMLAHVKEHTKEPTQRFTVEVTDSFGGEANYSWVRRYEIETPERYSQRDIVRAAKQAAGWSGIPARTSTDGGEGYIVNPVGMNQIMFIYPNYH